MKKPIKSIYHVITYERVPINSIKYAFLMSYFHFDSILTYCPNRINNHMKSNSNFPI